MKKKTILFLALFLNIICYLSSTPKIGEIYNNVRIKEDTTFEERCIFDDDSIYTVKQFYTPAKNKLVIEMILDQNLYSEEKSDFAFYCILMSFIDDVNHKYKGYYSMSMNTIFNYNNKKLVKRQYSYKLLRYDEND